MNIGITGHQDLSKYDLEWITKTIEMFMISNNIEKGYSSLAIGTDQLFVQLLLKLSIKYVAIIPCSNYESTFKTQASLKKYKSLLESASAIQILNYSEPNEVAFYEAGKKVIKLSDYLVAVWNGEKSQGLGGTADIVKYAAAKSKTVFHINPTKQSSTVINN